MKIEPGEKYYFDPEAAERPIRFVEKFCKHSEGRFAGESFRLLDWQKDEVIRPLFGWKRKDNGLRRFQELFLLTSKGAGKTPLLAAIALYCLVADGEASPHCISMAASFEQASLTHEEGKRYIDQSKDLSRLCEPQQYKIKLRNRPGKWSLVSGKPTGRSGSRPSCVIADEAHEWLGPTAAAYNLIAANLFKRRQPLLLVATNAPSSRTSFCYSLYERAKAVLNGKSENETLLPVIYEADRSLEWTSEAAARAANPSIPAIITWSQLAPRLAKAKESDEDEAEYRRLYLSQQVQSAKKWLDIGQWDACMAPFDPATVKDCPVYVGMDISQGDDLCAVTYIYATSKGFTIDSRFWMPRTTADRYIKQGFPYQQWADANAITLIEENTISPAVKHRIAANIIAISKTNKVKAVCYDRYKADACIAALEAAGLTCVPVGQGWGVSRGCEELDRRIKERSIQIVNNPVLRACAEVVEIKTDDRGNYWPVKPNANGRYAGKRSAKIDGISALVTALTEARKHTFATKAPSAKAWIIK